MIETSAATASTPLNSAWPLFQVVVIIERIFFPWSAATQETAIA